MYSFQYAYYNQYFISDKQFISTSLLCLYCVERILLYRTGRWWFYGYLDNTSPTLFRPVFYSVMLITLSIYFFFNRVLRGRPFCKKYHCKHLSVTHYVHIRSIVSCSNLTLKQINIQYNIRIMILPCWLLFLIR